MKKLILFLAASLALTGCDQTAADGYVFAQPEYELTDMRVKLVTYNSLQELRAAQQRIDPSVRIEPNSELMAFAQIDGRGNCTIHTLDPKVQYAPEWMGHEFAHCAWGRWHP